MSTARSRRVMLTLFVVILGLFVGPGLQTAGAAGDTSKFFHTWARTDQPVDNLIVNRTWMWGPIDQAYKTSEPYAETPATASSPAGWRTVMYFDKSRMEINDPNADSSQLWYVTNGLLVVELMTGNMQVGDKTFEPHDPAQINVAGDPDDTSGPTYATLALLMNRAPGADGTTIVKRVDRQGNVSDDLQMNQYNVTNAYHVQENGIDHQVASVFWDFMNSEGTVYSDADGYVTDKLFENPFYATGYPVTDAYWATVKVAGQMQNVLMQCFERRCLTYTPGNPDGWKVEAGNVGQHYFKWRYGKQLQTEIGKIALISLNDGGTVGCQDSIQLVDVPIIAGDTPEAKTENALTALFALHDSTFGESGLYTVFSNNTIHVDSVQIEAHTATVNLSGEFVLAGECDNPRAKAQIESTVTQYSGVSNIVVLRNGAPAFDEH